jgi:CBS domain-containing protein
VAGHPDDQHVRPAAPPETLDHDPRLSDLCSGRVVAVVPDTPVRTALQLMLARDVHHLPVYEGPRCTGVVTETDLLRGIAAQHSPIGWTTLTAGDVRAPAVVLPGRARVSDAAAAMATHACDAVLVELDGRVGGIVTATDVVRYCATGHRPPAGRRGG